MERISAIARSSESGLVDVRGDALADLRRRPDFRAVLDYLAAKDYVRPQRFDGDVWFVSLTPAGRAYFEDRRDAASDRRWTRGLAIAALILSLLALLLELDDRGYLGGAFRLFRSSQSEAEWPRR